MGNKILLPIKKKKKFLMFAFSSTNSAPLDDNRSYVSRENFLQQ